MDAAAGQGSTIKKRDEVLKTGRIEPRFRPFPFLIQGFNF